MIPFFKPHKFPDDFAKYWEEIEQLLWDSSKREIQEDGKPTFNNILSVAIRSWCDKLNLSEQEKNDVNTWKQENIVTLSNFFQIGKITAKKKLNFNDDLKGDLDVIMVIAFVVVLVACAIYLLKKNKRENSFNNIRAVQANNQQTWTLLLVINVAKNGVIQSLKTNGRVTINDSDALYRATQYLWMGSKADFEQSEFKKWFFHKPYVSDIESEYDVYFVQIELDESDKGFKPNADQIDRIDAFRKLPNNSRNVTISERLPSKAYENNFLYSR